MPDFWTIDRGSGGGDGSKLEGCTIERTAIQTKLFAPKDEGGELLATVDEVEPPITFKSFSLPGDPDLKFSLTIWTFDWMDKNEAIGPWETVLSPDQAPESGDWTAQSGVTGEGERAAAADAY